MLINMSTDRIANLILRAGLAFAFLYPPFDALSNPDTWLGYFPAFMHGYVSDLTLLHSFGVVEVIIAFWILSGWRIFWPASIATIMLFMIVFFHMRELEVLFRDISIAATALYLALTEFPSRAK